MEEVNFERGGNLPVKKTRKRENEFGAKNVEKEKHKQTSKRDRIKEAKAIASENSKSQEVYSAKQLTLHSLVPDMNVMGIVKAAYPTYLSIALPGRLVGKVPITNISKSYSNHLRTFLDNPDLLTKPKTLKEMFTPGQILYTKVMDKCHGEKEEILLSLIPEDINSEPSNGAWGEGNILLCAVEEEEDHGYIMESGVKGFKAFLPKKNVKEAPTIGEVLFCKIKKISQSAVTLSAFKHNEMLKIDTADVPNLKTLLPGCVINFSIVRTLKDGLEGLIFDGSISAYVNEIYLPSKISINDNEIIGKKFKARILYIMPMSNQIFVTLNVDEPGKATQKLEFGELIENAKVIKQTSSGVLLKLNSNDRGFLPRRVIVKNLKNNFDIDSVLIKYSPNSTHVVRVMDFSSFENCYLCTNDGKFLHEKHFGVNDIEIGDLVQGRIEEKVKEGFRLKIGNLRAYLQGNFLNKSSKLSVGNEIRVRVAEVDNEAKFLQVTNLPGFLKDSARILRVKNQIKVGESFAGLVMHENEKSYGILFFNHIKGFLPRTPENESDIVSLGGLKVGAIKHFEIKYVKNERITLSLPKKVDTANLGKIFECKVTAVLPTGLQIFIDNLKVYGKVPINFLSEFSVLAPLIHSKMKENDKFEVVAMGNNIYSRRDVEYYRTNPVTDFKDVNPGDILRCFVKSSDAENIELDCPLKNFNQTIQLNRNAFDDPENVDDVKVDDIVYVSVIAKNESHRNSLYVSPSLIKVWNNDVESSLDIVKSYLNDTKYLLEKFKNSEKSIGKFKIGERIGGKIKNIIANNLVIEVDDEVFAQGPVDNIQSYKIGGSVKDAVIVWIDPVQMIIHVTLKDKHRDDISVDQKADVSLVNEKKHKSTIVYFNNYITVCTMRKAGMPLIYTPSKLHYNDFQATNNRVLGNATSKLIIKKMFDGKLLGGFVQHHKVFQKLERFKTKLKRKIDDNNVSSTSFSTTSENKKPKVILDASESEEENEEERKTETESEDEKPKVSQAFQRFNESFSMRGRKLSKSFKGTLTKTKLKLTSVNKRNLQNKDSILNENLVNLVSYKSIKEGETSDVIKKPTKPMMKKSTIGKKSKPKRLLKRK
ncbi:CLUMA_CG012981, isoform A [Clunio marinus]|uniref:rRNA biogenesis protein RRP5 n=1 Tax=Clunio marinus TaxID=568069 RepID=A0A1J1IMM1_9DIPT|nr:CLUMA_CG012981, isoform A [Clunio marinus]